MSGFWSYPNRLVVSNIYNFGVLVAQVATKNWILTMLREPQHFRRTFCSIRGCPGLDYGEHHHHQWKWCFFFVWQTLSNTFHWTSGWWLNQPNWKILAKLEIFPKFRGENTQYLKPPTKHCRAFGVKDHFLQIPPETWEKKKNQHKNHQPNPQSSPKICGGLCFVSDWFPPLPKSPI